MKIIALTVQNYKALAKMELQGISDAVVLAGPNGCGKSCVLDAIRFLKSVYGSYERDEVEQFFGEQQIDAKKEIRQISRLLRDKDVPLRITADFKLSDSETTYLRNNLQILAENRILRDIAPNTAHLIPGDAVLPSLAATLAQMKPHLESRLPPLLAQLSVALDQPFQRASISITPEGRVERAQNALLELLFITFVPKHLGVIEFTPAHRNFNRERVTSVNLSVEQSETQQRQTALYNSANRYSSLKTEMTSAYVRNLLAAAAEGRPPQDDTLSQTLKELFKTFFTGKEFMGAQPTSDGRLLFQVRLATGHTHDIDELSSGEKEVVYGYLRLHNSSSQHSILMIDEPELHLNPKLVSGLAAFYFRNLGARLDNQLWLVTHSDTLIREAVFNPNYSVFHIQPAEASREQQAVPVKAKGDIERVVMDLVGDLAAYRPGGKVVVFESTAEAAFDQTVTCTLFPDFEQKVNVISAGSKKRVGDLYTLLDLTRTAGHIDTRFYAITDADDDSPADGPSNRFQWDVYHIENYLLSPHHILVAAKMAGISDSRLNSETLIEQVLTACARETIPKLIAHRMRVYVNALVLRQLDLSFDPSRTDIASALREAIDRSVSRVTAKSSEELNDARLAALEATYRGEYESALSDGNWRTRFRGRDVLQMFSGRYVSGMQYEYFRSLIISAMASEGFQPEGMKKFVTAILAAK